MKSNSKFQKQEIANHNTKYYIKFQIQNKVPAITHLSDLWEHTLNEILNHDAKSDVGIIMRAWVKHNMLEDITSF